MSTSKQSFANLGAVTISTPNPNLDGTGTLGTVLTGANSGTVIDKIIIKAQGATSEGMIRLFIDDGTNVLLYQEVYIQSSVQNPEQKTVEIWLHDKLVLNSGDILKASTENGDIFNIIANGTDWNQCSCGTSVTCSSTREDADTGLAFLSVANPNLDGTGTIPTVLTVPSGALVGGTMINYVNIKAITDTREGMIRLFVDDGTTKYLFSEISIESSLATSIEPSYRTFTNIGLYLNAGYKFCASTEVDDGFNIWADAREVTNCSCS